MVAKWVPGTRDLIAEYKYKECPARLYVTWIDEALPAGALPGRRLKGRPGDSRQASLYPDTALIRRPDMRLGERLITGTLRNGKVYANGIGHSAQHCKKVRLELLIEQS